MNKETQDYICIDCKQPKTKREMSINKKNLDGLNKNCKSCKTEYVKKYKTKPKDWWSDMYYKY